MNWKSTGATGKDQGKDSQTINVMELLIPSRSLIVTDFGRFSRLVLSITEHTEFSEEVSEWSQVCQNILSPLCAL